MFQNHCYEKAARLTPVAKVNFANLAQVSISQMECDKINHDENQKSEYDSF